MAIVLMSIFVFIPAMWRKGERVEYNEECLPARYMDIKDKMKPAEEMFADEVHPSEKGHRVIAESLFEYLQSTIERLVPARK